MEKLLEAVFSVGSAQRPYIGKRNFALFTAQISKTWKEAKVIGLSKHGKDPKFHNNLRPIIPLSTTGTLYEKAILKIAQKHIEERGLLSGSQVGFHASHSTTLQCMRLTDHVILNFNNNMSTAAVFLNIEKACNTTWQCGSLCKLYKLEFSTSVIKLISFFLS
jgi:hypothetical protein